MSEKRRKVKFQGWVTPELHASVETYCAGRRITKGHFIAAALGALTPAVKPATGHRATWTNLYVSNGNGITGYRRGERITTTVVWIDRPQKTWACGACGQLITTGHWSARDGWVRLHDECAEVEAVA